MAALQRQVADLAEKNTQLRDQLSKYVSELSTARYQLSAANRKLAAQRQVAEETLSEKEALEKEAARLRAYATKMEAKLSATAQESGLAAAVERQMQLEGELQSRDSALAEAGEKISQLQNELLILANAVAMKEEDWGLTPRRTADGQAAPPPAAAAVNALRSSLLRTISALKHESDAFALQLREEEKQTASLREAQREAEAEATRLRKRASDAELKYDQLAVDYDQLQALRAKDEESAQQIQQLQARNLELTEQLRAIATAFQGTKPADVLARYSACADGLARAQDESRDLESRLRSSDGRCSELEAEVVRLEAERDKSREDAGEQRARAQELAQRLEQAEASKAALERKNERYSGLAEENDRLGGRIAELEAEIHNLQAQKVHLQKALVGSARARLGVSSLAGSVARGRTGPASMEAAATTNTIHLEDLARTNGTPASDSVRKSVVAPQGVQGEQEEQVEAPQTLE